MGVEGINDVLFLLEGAGSSTNNFVALNEEGVEINEVLLDFSTTQVCSNLHMAVSSETAYHGLALSPSTK